jgi:penicillin amidase
MWQMDVLRRLAGGELAEAAGPAALESDRASRHLRIRRLAEMHVSQLTAGDRLVLASYARGVNAYLSTHRDRLPVEFKLMGYEPRPWTMADSIVCALQMFRKMTDSSQDEVTKWNMLETGDAAKVSYLFPTRMGSEVQLGSNAWAIHGSRTASGKPLLANDPHLEFSFPSTWHQVHLQAPGLNAAGVALPGVPAIVIGHNERIAWGMTNLHFDVMDFFLEDFDPNTGRYLRDGVPRAARLEKEWIRVKGERPFEFVQWVTDRGPVTLVNARWMSRRWVAAESGRFQFPLLELNQARNWEEFRRALSRFPGPGQNLVYADVDGNIGYQAVGILPVREGYRGDIPADSSRDWKGFIPFDEMPRAFNPSAGTIVTGNQNPFPASYHYPVEGHFASPYRARQIQTLLEARNGWKPEEMLTIQKDVYSAFSHYLAKELVRAYESRGTRNSALAGAAAALKAWNGQMEKDQAGPLVATLAFQQLRRAVAERAAPGKGAQYEDQMASAVIERLLRERPADWFSDYDELLLRALADAVDEGSRRYGKSVESWKYGNYLFLDLPHPVLGRIPVLPGLLRVAAWKPFQIGPIAMSGASTTVKQTTGRLGPSMRFVADLSSWDRSLNNITIGVSGQFGSSHFQDQWESYYVGRSFPMQFNAVEAKQTLTVEPE